MSVVHFIYSFLPTFIVSNRSSFMCVCVRELGHKMYMETIRLVNSTERYHSSKIEVELEFKVKYGT